MADTTGRRQSTESVQQPPKTDGQPPDTESPQQPPNTENPQQPPKADGQSPDTEIPQQPPKESLDDAVYRQKDAFKVMGCGATPTFYFVHYTSGAAHWSSYSWGWGLSYMNMDDGYSSPCGSHAIGGIGLCKECYKNKGDEIREMCKKFDLELQENHSDEISGVTRRGMGINITTTYGSGRSVTWNGYTKNH